MTLPRRSGAALATLAAPLLLAGLAEAQIPKKFDWYEDSARYGFKVKVPEDWDLIPPQPGEDEMIAEFSHPTQYSISVGGGEVLLLFGWLVCFDGRERPDEVEATDDGESRRIRIRGRRHEDVLSWISDKERTGGRGWKLIEEERLRGPDVPAVAQIFEAPMARARDGDVKVRVYAAVYDLDEDLQIALVFNGPGDRKWRKYESAFAKMAKSFERVEIEEIVDPELLGKGSLRARKRAKLQMEVATSPGWTLFETDNYFVITNNPDDDFNDELLERLEAIRAVYEEQYPPEVARRSMERARQRQEEEEEERDGEKDGEEGDDEEGDGEDDDDEEGEDEEDDAPDQRSISVQADPLEASRTSVVRVTANRDQYMKYGGPGGSAGYWSWVDEELVLYDDKAVRGRDFTWLVLNHEAFHQYIFYFYGNLSPHSWYNEGTGDYYSGFEYKRKRFQEAKPVGREREIQSMIRTGEYAPLRDFVRWSQSEYYGNNDLGIPGYRCYAQGWSLIWFLRTGEKNRAPGWNDDWNDILAVYLDALVETGDLDDAVDRAFAGVDWEELEAAWKAYIG